MREMKRKKKCHEKLIRLCCWIIRHLEFSFLFFVNLSMIPFFFVSSTQRKLFCFFFSLITSFFFLPLFSSCFFFFKRVSSCEISTVQTGGKKPWEETRTSWASEIFFLLRQKCSSTKEEIPNRLQMRNSISAPTHYRQKEEEEKRVFFLVLLSALILSIEQLSKWDPTAQIVRRPHRHSIQMGYVQYISTYPTAFVESFKRTTN